MTNSADPDQLASSGSTLFAKAGYIQAQQDKVKFYTIHGYSNEVGTGKTVSDLITTLCG